MHPRTGPEDEVKYFFIEKLRKKITMLLEKCENNCNFTKNSEDCFDFFSNNNILDVGEKYEK